MGTYDPSISDNLFRIQELRGVARWWLRAIIADILGFKKKKIIDLQEKIFGGTSSSSLIHFRSTIPHTDECLETIIRSARVGWYRSKYVAQIAWHPRLNILFMEELKEIRGVLKKILRHTASTKIHAKLWYHLQKKLNRDLSRMFKYYSLTLEVYTPTKSADNIIWKRIVLGLYALALGLALSGLGKGSRRGFGAFSFRIDFHPLKKDAIWGRLDGEIKDKMNSLEEAIVRLGSGDLGTLCNILERLYYAARELTVSITKNTIDKPTDTPPIYSLSPNNFSIHLIPIDKIMIPSKEYGNIYFKEWESIVTICNILFCRTTFHPLALRLLGKLGVRTLPSILQDVEGRTAKRLGSYILGLPRIGKPREEEQPYFYTIERHDKHITIRTDVEEKFTGFKPAEGDRRASPIILTLLNHKILALTSIFSEDFPKEIVWGTTKRRERIQVLKVKDAFKDIKGYLNTLTERLNGEIVKV